MGHLRIFEFLKEFGSPFDFFVEFIAIDHLNNRLVEGIFELEFINSFVISVENQSVHDIEGVGES